MDYKIESDVPLPVRGQPRAQRFPFAQLKIGQSFKVPLADGDTKERLKTRIYHHLKRWRDEHPEVTLTTAWREPEDETDRIEGLRIWRGKDKA
jgi:hypothetical protein